MNDEPIISGCRRRDRDAQRQLYELHVERIYRTVLRMTRDREAAFDVTQETFVRAFRKIDSFDGRAVIGTWLYRIATNEALQFLRKRETERRHLRIVAQERAGSGKSEVPADYSDIEAALAALSEHDRAVLVLRYQEGLSYDEIAVALDCAAGTVASRLNRARSRVRAILADSAEAGEESGRLSHQTE